MKSFRPPVARVERKNRFLVRIDGDLLLKFARRVAMPRIAQADRCGQRFLVRIENGNSDFRLACTVVQRQNADNRGVCLPRDPWHGSPGVVVAGATGPLGLLERALPVASYPKSPIAAQVFLCRTEAGQRQCHFHMPPAVENLLGHIPLRQSPREVHRILAVAGINRPVKQPAAGVGNDVIELPLRLRPAVPRVNDQLDGIVVKHSPDIVIRVGHGTCEQTAIGRHFGLLRKVQVLVVGSNPEDALPLGHKTRRVAHQPDVADGALPFRFIDAAVDLRWLYHQRHGRPRNVRFRSRCQPHREDRHHYDSSLQHLPDTVRAWQEFLVIGWRVPEVGRTWL